MNMTLNELDKMIEETEKYLEDLKATHRVMSRSTTTSKIYNKNNDIASPDLNDTGFINIEDLDIPKPITKSSNTLFANIEKIVKRFGTQEFTVNHVNAALKQMGKGSDAKHFKNRVSIIIKQLNDSKVIKRIFEGKGNVPHKYKLTHQVSIVKSSSNED